MASLTDTVGSLPNVGDEQRANRGKQPYQPRIGANVRSAAPDFQTIPEALTAWAQQTPKQIAMLSPRRAPLDYAGLVGHAQRICLALEAKAVMPPQRVALCIQDRPSLALCLIGLLYHGSPVIPVDPDMTAEKLENYLARVQADAVVTIAGENTVTKASEARLGLTVIEFPEIGLQFGDIDRAPEPPAYVPDPASWALLLSTSGTTEQKIVPRSHGKMAADVDQRAKWLGLEPQDRCLNVMPLYHMQGIYEGLLAPLVSGGSSIITARSDTEALFECLDAYKPTWSTAVYTFYRDVLAQAPRYERVITDASLSFIKAGGMRFPQADAEKIEALFNAPVITSYGSSEAGYIACEPLPPRKRKAGSVGVQVIDELKLIDERGANVAAGQSGEVVVRGPGVISGYVDDPEADAQAFIDGWFRTGDEGYLDDEGYLYLTGRTKEMINRGGEKISPIEIDDALMAHPHVTAAATFAIPHATLGEEVAAAVVLEQGSTVSIDELKDSLKKRLTPRKIPRRIVFVDALPKTASGKIKRNVLARSLGLDGTGGPDIQPAAARIGEDSDRPASPLEAQLQEVWAATLNRDHVGLHDDYFDLGGDSLQAVEMFLQVEEALGRRLPKSILIEAGTVAEMAKHIESAAPPSCLVPLQPRGDRAPFFCVHDIKGDIFTLRDLACHLGKTRPFYGIRHVGADGEEGNFADMESMAAHYVSEVRGLQPTGPYCLGGHSFGGKVAFVMAQQLLAAGERVALLALIDTHIDLGRRYLPLPQRLARHTQAIAGQPLLKWPEYVGRRAGKIGSRIGRSFQRRSSPVTDWFKSRDARSSVPDGSWETLQKINAIYQVKPYCGDAVLFRADRNVGQHPDVHNGWRRLIEGSLRIVPVTGSHMEILREPNVRELANKLGACMEE